MSERNILTKNGFLYVVTIPKRYSVQKKFGMWKMCRIKVITTDSLNFMDILKFKMN
jgi:hypothetical protein